MINETPVYRYRRFKPTTLFYHVTGPEHVEGIERDGLCADNEGNIFAFTDLIAAESIATNQVGANPYALFWIDASGISGKVYADDVAEWSRVLQCIIRQSQIEPKYIHYLGTMAVHEDAQTPWQRLVDARYGMTRQQSEESFAKRKAALEEFIRARKGR